MRSLSAGASAGRTNLCAEYRTLGLQVDGGLAEYVTSPAAICRAVPDSVRRRRGSDGAAPGRRAPRALPRRAAARTRPSRSSAPAGSARSSWRAHRSAQSKGGSSRSTSTTSGLPRRARSARARSANATGKDLAELLLELTDGVGFDVVIEASGAPHAPARGDRRRPPRRARAPRRPARRPARARAHRR